MNQIKANSLEICVDNIESLLIADRAVVDRIELCSSLALGGLTPSYALAKRAINLNTPIMAMIRPRTGGFAYTTLELELMMGEIKFMNSIGIFGVVFGAGNAQGLDMKACEALMNVAGSMNKTLHRCFDLIEDQSQALEQAIELGFDRILTSGGQKTAAKGAEQLSKLVRLAGGRIEIMAGSGVNLHNVDLLVRSGITSFHASCSRAENAENSLINFGFSSATQAQTDRSTILKLKEKLN